MNVPEGWKLVPVKATEEMIRFAGVAVPKTPNAQWNAMVAAAPEPDLGAQDFCEVKLVSYAEDMSTCTLTNGDGKGYFYNRIEADGVQDLNIVQGDAQPVFMVREHGSHCYEEITGESLKLCQSMPEEYEVRKLYTDAVTPLVARLQWEIERHQGELNAAQAILETAYAEHDKLRAQLETAKAGMAERDVRLLNIIEACEYGYSMEAIEEIATIPASADPVAPCQTCKGSRLVNDGELYCSAGGTPFENGPIKCVKDCPDCAEPATVSQKPEVIKKALNFENQKIFPARFKCLACGDYHEGSGNLPCPKMSPMSISQKSEGE